MSCFRKQYAPRKAVQKFFVVKIIHLGIVSVLLSYNYVERLKANDNKVQKHSNNQSVLQIDLCKFKNKIIFKSVCS